MNYIYAVGRIKKTEDPDCNEKCQFLDCNDDWVAGVQNAQLYETEKEAQTIINRRRCGKVVTIHPDTLTEFFS